MCNRRPHPHSSTFHIHLLIPSPTPHHHQFTIIIVVHIFITEIYLFSKPHKIQREINLAMAAQKCMISIMDRLWFHQIILFSEPSLFSAAEDAQKPSQSLSEHSSLTQHFSPRDETETERPTRLSLQLVSTKERCHSHSSSSPISAHKRYSRNHGYRSEQKSMSCKRLVDLELEEVKGFMDLGFLFRKENLTKNIINLLPGLQRIISYDEEERKEITRPYLSEAWIITSPDSPLRIPRASTAAVCRYEETFEVLGSHSCISHSPTILIDLIIIYTSSVFNSSLIWMR